MAFNKKPTPGQLQPEQQQTLNKVSVDQLLYRQIERVNMAASGQEGGNFEGCVDQLFKMVPNVVKQAIVKRVKEYRISTDKLVFKYNCGVPMGTIEHPVRDKYGSIYSPIMERSEFIDYHLLCNIILEECENFGVTWRYDRITLEQGRVDAEPVRIPPQTIEIVRQKITELMDADANTGEKYTYYDLIQILMPTEIPQTPEHDPALLEAELIDENEEMGLEENIN
jgi:hypothetical protein